MLVQKGADISVSVNVPTECEDQDLEEGEKPAWKWRPFKVEQPEADIYPLFQVTMLKGVYIVDL
jgi:hypothetical protein